MLPTRRHSTTGRVAKDNQDPDTDRQLHQTADSNQGQGEQLNTNKDFLVVKKKKINRNLK